MSNICTMSEAAYDFAINQSMLEPGLGGDVLQANFSSKHSETVVRFVVGIVTLTLETEIAS